jgi:NDP-sugar pyrophosphorylase family protein
VWAEPGVDVDVTASLVGPSVLGAGVRIEARARVEASMIGRAATVGTGASVLRSVVLPGVTIAPGDATKDEAVDREAVLPCG